MGGRRSSTISSSERARELARRPRRSSTVSPAEVRRLLSPLAPAAVAALRAALDDPDTRVQAARVVLERLLPPRAAIALALEAGDGTGEVRLRMVIPGASDSDSGSSDDESGAD